MITPNVQPPQPSPTETPEAYTIRAHRALLPLIHDPAERNAIIRHAWAASRGPTDAEKIAADSFDRERYELSEDHCVFAAHEAVGADGRPRKYDLSSLARIVREMNGGIIDRGAFPAISDGHTANPGEGGKKPKILGYSGPFRLGMIGRNKPTWAIFADEYHAANSKDVLSGAPRRSVELWTFKDGRMRFDPIAAIGAEAPRLNLPHKFEAHHQEGATLERYTVAAPSYPSGGNTYLKSTQPKKAGKKQAMPTAAPASRVKRTPFNKSKYALDAAPPAAPGAGMDPDVAKLLAALRETPEFQFLGQLMAQQQQAQAPPPPAAPPDMNGDGDQDAADAATAAGAGQVDDADDLADLAGLLDEDDDQPKKNTMPQQYQLRPGESVTVERYTALQASHTNAVKQIGRLTARLGEMERYAADAARGERLRSIAQQFPLAVDFEEEAAECLYSNGSTMTDDQFEQRCGMIERYAAKFEHSPMIPAGDSRQVTYGHQAQAEKYEAKQAAEAVRIFQNAQDAGRTITYDEAMAEAAKRLQQ